MADLDIDPIGEHESRPEEPTDENIPPDPVGERWALGSWGHAATPSTWEPERGVQKISFRGEEELKKRKLLSELQLKTFKRLNELPEEFHYDNFKLREG